MPRPYFYSTRAYTPKDKLIYHLPYQVIHDTEKVLKQYNQNEGLVYWGGIKEGNNITATSVIAPKTEFDWGRVTVSHKSNFDFVEALNKHNLIQVAQVHSHPSEWVGHSLGDDQMAAFKTEGLLSIVVPEYSKNGMLPLSNCGIHRFIRVNFKRLSDKYVEKHFLLTDEIDSFLEDLRQ